MTRIVSTEVVRKGYATVSLVTLSDGEGETHQREVVSFGEAACVLPYDPDRNVALVVRLPRAPLLLAGEAELLIEAPAGMIDGGESPEAAARREAMEEVGVVLRELEPVSVCWTSPGVVDERSHLFLAPYGLADRTGLGGGLTAEHEDITVEERPLRDLAQLAAEGRLHDLKTLSLILTLRLRRPDLF